MEETRQYTAKDLEAIRDLIFRPFVSAIFMTIFFEETEGQEDFESKVIERFDRNLKKTFGKHDTDSKLREFSVSHLKKNISTMVAYLIKNGGDKLEDIVIQIEEYTDEQAQKIHEIVLGYENYVKKN